MSACKIVIVSGIVCTVLLQSTMLCTAKTVHIPLRSITVFLLFLREFWQNISRNSLFYPFHSPFNPLLFLPSEGMKSVVSNPYFRRKSVFFIPRFYRKSVVFNYWFIGKVCLGMLERGKIYNGRFQINASGTCHFLSFTPILTSAN